MSLLQYKRLTSISNVAPSTTVTINCPVGPTYHEINLEFGGTLTLAEMKNIQVLINGKPVQTFADGNELKLINDYYGRFDGTASGFLSIPLIRPELESMLLQRMTALGTNNVQTLAVQLDIGAVAAGPTLSAFSVIEARKQDLNLITKVKRFPETFGTAGDKDIDDILRGPRIWAIHFKKADVNNVKLLLDGQEVRDMSKARLEQIQQQAPSPRVPQTASMTTLDFHLSGHLDDLLVTGGLQEFRAQIDLGTSGDVVTIVEYLDKWAGI